LIDVKHKAMNNEQLDRIEDLLNQWAEVINKNNAILGDELDRIKADLSAVKLAVTPSKKGGKKNDGWDWRPSHLYTPEHKVDLILAVYDPADHVEEYITGGYYDADTGFWEAYGFEDNNEIAIAAWVYAPDFPGYK